MAIQSNSTILYNDIVNTRNDKWVKIGGTWSESNWAVNATPFGSGNISSTYSGNPIVFIWYYKPGTKGAARYFTSMNAWTSNMVDDGYSDCIIVNYTLPNVSTTSSSSDFKHKTYVLRLSTGKILQTFSKIYTIQLTNGNYGSTGSWNTSEVLYPIACYAFRGESIT